MSSAFALPVDPAAMSGQLAGLQAAVEKIADMLSGKLGKQGEAAGDKVQKAAQQSASKFGLFREAVDKVSTSLRAMGFIASAAGALSAASIERMVAVSNPAIVDRLRLSWMQVSGVLGQMFAPVVLRVADGVRELATWLYNLDPSVKAMIVAVGVASVVAVAAIGAIVTAIMVLNAALTATSVLSGGITIAIGLVATALVGAATAAGGVVGYMAYFGQSMSGVKDALWGAWAAIKAVFSSLWQSTQPIFSAIVDGFKALWSKLQPGFDKLQGAVASVMALFKTFSPQTKSFADSLRDSLGKAAEFVGKAFEKVAAFIEKTIDVLHKAVIAAAAVADAVKSGSLTNMTGIQNIIRARIKEYEANKEEAKKALKGGKPADTKAAPVFGLQARFSGIAEAKDEFYQASLRASAGVVDTAKKQNDLAEEGNRLQRENNELTRQLLDAYNLRGSQRGAGI